MTKFSVQYIFRTYGPKYIENHKLSKEQWKVYNSIINCKSLELGIHIITCTECGNYHIGLNSCRNRHCPNCQFYAREKWIQNESSYLLNCPYFHIVTTIPSELNDIFLYNSKTCYDILFNATSETILQLAKDDKWLGATVGITSILHTWGQNLQFHPHIHSIVTGGGIHNNNWIHCKDNYLFKVQVLSSLFKKKFLAMLKNSKLNFPKELDFLNDTDNFNKFIEPLFNKSWITYIEPPKSKPENVIEYIGRYSFKVAISDNRIIDVSNGMVTFEYKDYKDNSKIKSMTISCEEFIRRFLLHVLPSHFTKIRHYGILSNRNRKSTISLCRILIRTVVNKDFSISLKRKLKVFTCSSCGGTSFSYKFLYCNFVRLTDLQFYTLK